MIRFNKTNAFAAACNMPPLNHQPKETFDWKNSEVVKWLMSNPTIQKYVFTKMQHSGAILYDHESGLWSGKDYVEPMKTEVRKLNLRTNPD